MKSIISWSGGKDSCFATMQALAQGHQPVALLNMMNENGKISRSHALSLNILQQQAQQLDLPLFTAAATWADYESEYLQSLQKIKNQHPVEAIVFGDIDIISHREWEEKISQTAQLKALLPLWQQDRVWLVKQMIDSGIECIITSCNAQMGSDFLGRKFNLELVDELLAKNIDPCGENGEFHTLVTHCPIFKKAIQLPNFSKQSHQNYHFLVWE